MQREATVSGEVALIAHSNCPEGCIRDGWWVRVGSPGAGRCLSPDGQGEGEAACEHGDHVTYQPNWNTGESKRARVYTPGDSRREWGLPTKPGRWSPYFSATDVVRA